MTEAEMDRIADKVVERLVGGRGVLAKGGWNPDQDASLLEWAEVAGGNTRAIAKKVGVDPAQVK